ncbi:hypothetical protein C1I97_05285 [Streptomyces sp. NTH33]|uniref:hypothetical protein n=1 Tax=Streptomyces sp. NTH33 TaxID=1735453 RepID=UPI000DA9AB45|nr:hypothetical protein [Streptomyces sp. NTH33]PZH17368.1 hypothetical protein C1I97_05285 [Streptomyces sp. NTH33]
MSGRADSDTHPGISEAGDTEAGDTEADDVRAAAARDGAEDADDAGGGAENDAEGEEEDPAQVARRARWTAAGAGALLALAGLAAALLRLTGPAPALVPAAYALGAAVCALAAFLGSRGRTRRALWLLIAGVMVMALGDQFD